MILIEVAQPQSHRLHSSPFTENPGFTGHWWGYDRGSAREYVNYYSGRVGDAEVARAKLTSGVWLDAYCEVPIFGEPPLLVDLLEVHDQYRGLGLGKAALALLIHKVAPRRLVALSEEADGFWESLGWTKHFHMNDTSGAQRSRTLFCQP